MSTDHEATTLDGQSEGGRTSDTSVSGGLGGEEAVGWPDQLTNIDRLRLCVEVDDDIWPPEDVDLDALLAEIDEMARQYKATFGALVEGRDRLEAELRECKERLRAVEGSPAGVAVVSEDRLGRLRQLYDYVANNPLSTSAEVHRGVGIFANIQTTADALRSMHQSRMLDRERRGFYRYVVVIGGRP
jgi:hypothetical protein